MISVKKRKLLYTLLVMISMLMLIILAMMMMLMMIRIYGDINSQECMTVSINFSPGIVSLTMSSSQHWKKIIFNGCEYQLVGHVIKIIKITCHVIHCKCKTCPRMVLWGPWKSHSIKHLNFLYSPLVILTKRRPLLTVAFCNYPMGCIVFDLCCDQNYP